MSAAQVKACTQARKATPGTAGIAVEPVHSVLRFGKGDPQYLAEASPLFKLRTAQKYAAI